MVPVTLWNARCQEFSTQLAYFTFYGAIRCLIWPQIANWQHAGSTWIWPMHINSFGFLVIKRFRCDNWISIHMTVSQWNAASPAVFRLHLPLHFVSNRLFHGKAMWIRVTDVSNKFFWWSLSRSNLCFEEIPIHQSIWLLGIVQTVSATCQHSQGRRRTARCIRQPTQCIQKKNKFN